MPKNNPTLYPSALLKALGGFNISIEALPRVKIARMLAETEGGDAQYDMVTKAELKAHKAICGTDGVGRPFISYFVQKFNKVYTLFLNKLNSNDWFIGKEGDSRKAEEVLPYQYTDIAQDLAQATGLQSIASSQNKRDSIPEVKYHVNPLMLSKITDTYPAKFLTACDRIKLSIKDFPELNIARSLTEPDRSYTLITQSELQGNSAIRGKDLSGHLFISWLDSDSQVCTWFQADLGSQTVWLKGSKAQDLSIIPLRDAGIIANNICEALASPFSSFNPPAYENINQMPPVYEDPVVATIIGLYPKELVANCKKANINIIALPEIKVMQSLRDKEGGIVDYNPLTKDDLRGYQAIRGEDGVGRPFISYLQDDQVVTLFPENFTANANWLLSKEGNNRTADTAWNYSQITNSLGQAISAQIAFVSRPKKG